MKHKHYDMIVAWANGKKIETRLNGGEWHELITPAWNGIDTEYRIKPEPVPDEVQEFLALRTTFVSGSIMKNLRLTFDGETGKLKSAEVI